MVMMWYVPPSVNHDGKWLPVEGNIGRVGHVVRVSQLSRHGSGPPL